MSNEPNLLAESDAIMAAFRAARDEVPATDVRVLHQGVSDVKFVHQDGAFCATGFAWCPAVRHRLLSDFMHHVQPGAARTDCDQPRGALSTSTAITDTTCPACARVTSPGGRP